MSHQGKGLPENVFLLSPKFPQTWENPGESRIFPRPFKGKIELKIEGNLRLCPNLNVKKDLKPEIGELLFRRLKLWKFIKA